MTKEFYLPDGVRHALDCLTQAGYEAWIVGGSVRDHLLGRQPEDYDLATSALPEQTKAVFDRPGVKVLETGIRHGTLTVILYGMQLEITTYRVDGSYSDARHPDCVTFTRSLEEDAARRDFTINAMAYHPDHGVQDFFGGVNDLKEGLIRCVGDPATRFREDALRILRALRFSAQLAFDLEEDTALAAKETAPLLGEISAERVLAELNKLLVSPDAGEVVWYYPEILGTVLPPVGEMLTAARKRGGPPAALLAHTSGVVTYAPPFLLIRWAALCHDIGKLKSAAIYGEDHIHTQIGAEMTEQLLEGLKAPRSLITRVSNLVRLHHTQLPTEKKELRRTMSRLGWDTVVQLIDLQGAMARADGQEEAEAIMHQRRLKALVREILEEEPCLEVSQLAVNGRDVTERGVQGPDVGRILQALLDAVLDERVKNEKGPLLQLLNEMTGKNDEMSDPDGN